MTRTHETVPDAAEPSGEIDLRAMGAALHRRLSFIVTVALVAGLLIAITVNVIAPRYTAQSQVLLENQETFFTRPDRVNTQQIDQASQLDPEAVASQVQLITSRDIAHRAIKELGLEGNDEFDPLANGLNPFKRVLVLLGLMRDPTQETRDARIVTTFLDKLVVYSPPKTRVIVIEFTSRDADLAARAANTVASLYLKEQSAAKRQTAQEAAESLAAQVADLRMRLVKADDAREQYRAESGLLAGTNNMTISGQQLADINTDLSKARTSQADAQAKAQMIRDLLRHGQAADVPDVINNETVRRIAEQRVQVEGQLALEGRTLLPGHPRIKALSAQVQEYDRALKAAAKQAATTLENEATIAGSRVKNLETVLAQQKTLAGTANVDEVHLRTLERAADSLKDQLESSTTKYQEALARASSDATPADARVIQRAVAPQEASFPKRLPFTVFGIIVASVLAAGFVVAAELMGGPATESRVVEREVGEPVPVSVTAPVPHEAEVWGETVPKHRRSLAMFEPEPDDELVFAAPPPVAPASKGKRPTVARLKAMAVGGLLDAFVGRVKAFGQSAAAARANREIEDDGDVAASDLSDHAARGQVTQEIAEDRSIPGRRDGVGWDEALPSAEPEQPARVAAPSADRVALADRIVASHVPGHGLHVVGAGIATEDAATILDLARVLSERGRSIIVDLNRSPAKLAPLARSGGDGGSEMAALIGLSELLVGDASFAEVIHRDHASRLHYIPTGRQEADFRDFDLILDALTATYDFIVLLAPGYPHSEVAKIMAPYADFLVLAPGTGCDEAMLAGFERDLTDAGAREVLFAGHTPRPPRQDVA